MESNVSLCLDGLFVADCWDEFDGAPGLAQERNKNFVAEASR